MPLGVKKGFCGTSLYSSSLFLAWIQMFFACTFFLMSIVLLGVALSSPESIESAIEKANQSNETAEDPKRPHDVDPQMRSKLKDALFIIMVTSIMVVSTLLAFFIVLGLLVGIYKKNHCIMMPYLILSGVQCAFNILSCIGLFVGLFSGTLQSFTFFLTGVATTAFTCYCWLILYSQYEEIKEANLRTFNSFSKIDP